MAQCLHMKHKKTLNSWDKSGKALKSLLFDDMHKLM